MRSTSILLSVAAKHFSDSGDLSLNITVKPVLHLSGDMGDSKCWKAIMGKMKAKSGDFDLRKFVTQLNFDTTCFLSPSVHEGHLKAPVEKTQPIWDDFGDSEFLDTNGVKLEPIPDECRQDNKMICRVPKETGKGFSYIELKKRNLAKLPPLRIIGIITKGVIIVANDSVKGQGARSVQVKGTYGVGKGPNDEPTLNSDQHPDPHTRGTGSSTVGFGKKQVPFGDDDFDLAKRNDTAERLRKYLPLPLARAGTISKDDVGHEVDNIEANGNLDMGNGDTGDSDDEYYKQFEQLRASRTSAGSSSPSPVDGNDQITYQMENIVNVEGQDGGATPDIDCDFDLTPHIGRTGGTTTVGIAFSQASNSVEGQEASSSGHNGGSGAGSGSDESDQSTGSGGTDTNEGISRRAGGDEHNEDNRDEGNDEDRRRVSEESGTRRRARNSSNMRLVAIFIAIAVQSTSAIIALSLDGLSPLAKKLFTGVLVTNLVGFLCLYVALFPSRYISPRATEILVRVGGAAAAFGFLLMMGIKLSLGIIVPACVVILAVSVLSFMP